MATAMMASAVMVPMAAGHGERESRNGQFARGEDEQEVKCHVEHAHGDVEQTGHLHVAAAAQHAAGQKVDGEQRQSDDEDEKIGGGGGDDVFMATQPVG